MTSIPKSAVFSRSSRPRISHSPDPIRPAPIAALLTDFGTSDGYVAMVKAVILGGCRDARIVDITNEVPAGDVLHGTFVLRAAAPFFDPGTVFVAVVDPGVGTGRNMIAARIDRRFFLAPDNGLLEGLISREAHGRIVRVLRWKPRGVVQSRTFHGRDWLAPAAAELLKDPGFFDRLGPVTRLPKRLPGWFLNYRRERGMIRGYVSHVDHFGNIVTSIPRAALADADSRFLECRFGNEGKPISYRQTYGRAAGRGDLLWLVNSDGWVEVASRDGSAAALLEICRGDAVILRQGRGGRA